MSLNYIRGYRRLKRRHIQAVELEYKRDDKLELPDDELEVLYSAINRLPDERKKIFMMICLEGKNIGRFIQIGGSLFMVLGISSFY